MNLLADRRSRQRYDVVGVLRGTLELFDRVRVQNISGNGALIQATTPVAVDALQSIQLSLVGVPTRLTSRVRHVKKVGQPPNVVYEVGVEFISPPPALKESVMNLSGEAQPD